MSNAMSLEHTLQRRGHSKHPRQLEQLIPAYENDDEVLTFLEWKTLNKLSERTARRIIAAGPPTGPIVTQLSQKLIGITRGNNRRWLQGRARGA
jgi:hypothetical protein